jgi:hypothetical protein
MKLGVVVCDLSDLGKTGKSNSFIRLWLRQVESSLCQLRKAILSNFLTFDEQQYITFAFVNWLDFRSFFYSTSLSSLSYYRLPYIQYKTQDAVHSQKEPNNLFPPAIPSFPFCKRNNNDKSSFLHHTLRLQRRYRTKPCIISSTDRTPNRARMSVSALPFFRRQMQSS